MCRILTSAFLCFLLLTSFGVGTPVDGGSTKNYLLKPDEPWKVTKKFRGGERASVLAVGSRENEIVVLHVEVRDSKGTLIAEDHGTSSLTSDFVGVIWYPPRQGEEYQIEIRSAGALPNDCYITIK